jgi:hypothetical protein
VNESLAMEELDRVFNDLAGFKECGMCGVALPISEFCRNDGSIDGLHCHCNTCSNARVVADNRRSRADKSPKKMLQSAKTRAKRLGVPFTITAADLVVPDTCPVLGIPLDFSRHLSGPSDSSPSLDRVIPTLGYVPGNVAVISMRANRIKSNFTAAELLAVGGWVSRFIENAAAATING